MRRERARHGVVPVHRPVGQRRAIAACTDPVGNRQRAIVLRGQGIAVVMHDHVPQRRLSQQRRDLAGQLAGGEGRDGAAVGDDMAQLVGQQHGIGRHHHRAGAQDGEVGNDELRAVLAEQHHAVAGIDAAGVLQVAGHALGLRQQRGVGGGAVVELDRHLVREAARGQRQVLEHGCVRRMEHARHVAERDAGRRGERAGRRGDDVRVAGGIDGHAGLLCRMRWPRARGGHQNAVSPSSSRRAMVRRWISEVPSGMRMVRAQR
ncbi:hypothetical protein D9M70_301240 [compost metagenome]